MFRIYYYRKFIMATRKKNTVSKSTKGITAAQTWRWSGVTEPQQPFGESEIHSYTNVSNTPKESAATNALVQPFVHVVQDTLLRSAADTALVIKYLKRMKAIAYSAHLRMGDIHSYEVLIVVDKSKIYSDEFSKVYNYVNAFEQQATSQYAISFEFVGSDGIPSESMQNKILSDGYERMQSFVAL